MNHMFSLKTNFYVTYIFVQFVRATKQIPNRAYVIHHLNLQKINIISTDH